jgi:hypothetical protein
MQVFTHDDVLSRRPNASPSNVNPSAWTFRSRIFEAHSVRVGN